jgi:hypothetical protein
MALICVTGRRDPIEISNERAKVLKAKWLDETTPKDKKVDLGVWSGTYGQIKTIEITVERGYAPDSYFSPPTREERKRTAKGLTSVRDWLEQQSWYKEKRLDRHYTKEHAYKRCTCTRPEHWLFTIIEVQ